MGYLSKISVVSFLTSLGSMAGFAITFGGGPFVSDLAENRSETVSDLSENRSETKVGDTRPGQEPKENSNAALIMTPLAPL